MTALIPVLSGCSIFERSENTGGTAETAAQTEAARLDYSGYGFQALQNDNEKLLYAALDKAINKPYSEKFRAPKPQTAEKTRAILELYKDDHPDVFWLDDTSLYSYVESGDSITIELNFKLDGDALAAAKQRLEQSVRAATDNAPTDATDYQLELYVHDYLLEHCAYDSEAVELHQNDSVRANEQNAYGALVEGKAVCEGYARAFCLLCTRLGLKNWVLQGTSENVNHIWNCVELDGNWYHVDATWDDRDGESTSGSDNYYYFNVNDTEIKKDHTPAALYSDYDAYDALYNGYIPTCGSMDYNYFTLNGKTIVDLDSEDLPSFVAENAAAGAATCAFVVGDDLNFDDTYDQMVSSYAYNWLTSANEINGYEPQLNEVCQLAAYQDRRVITLILEYV